VFDIGIDLIDCVVAATAELHDVELARHFPMFKGLRGAEPFGGASAGRRGLDLAVARRCMRDEGVELSCGPTGEAPGRLPGGPATAAVEARRRRRAATARTGTATCR
jgi:hypothetical protein